MKTLKKTRILHETHEELSVRRYTQSQVRGTLEQCDACRTEVLFVALDDATRLSGLTARAIFRRVEAGQIHFKENFDGLVFICANSLKM